MTYDMSWMADCHYQMNIRNDKPWVQLCGTNNWEVEWKQIFRVVKQNIFILVSYIVLLKKTNYV